MGAKVSWIELFISSFTHISLAFYSIMFWSSRRFPLAGILWTSFPTLSPLLLLFLRTQIEMLIFVTKIMNYTHTHTCGCKIVMFSHDMLVAMKTWKNEKQPYVNLEGWFEVLSKWIWIWWKNMKCGKLNYLFEYIIFIYKICVRLCEIWVFSNSGMTFSCKI